MERLIDGRWCILAGPRWPRLLLRDRAPPQTLWPYYSAIYITEYHSSNPLPPAPVLSLQLLDTIRPVCYEGRVERSRQGHDNKLADGFRENKRTPTIGYHSNPYLAESLCSAPSAARAARSEWLPWPSPFDLADIKITQCLSGDTEARGVQRWGNLAERIVRNIKWLLDVAFDQKDQPQERHHLTKKRLH